MSIFNSLPDKALDNKKAITTMFTRRGIFTFQSACDYVHKLPYGRNTDRSDWALVLQENKGACSTKHALLKALADELFIDIDLVVGIYAMTAKNTLGIAQVLSKHNIEYIPEAHCYLKFKNTRYDFTRFNATAIEPINEFYSEKSITPHEIGDVKVNFHTNYIYRKYGREAFKKIWSIREECIKAISS